MGVTGCAIHSRAIVWSGRAASWRGSAAAWTASADG